jgi:uncharacterized protein
LHEDAAYWIAQLGLQPHPEGGYFRETYRSPLTIPAPDGYAGSRSASTAIYFLVTAAEPSHLHRLATDEIWHHYAGDSLELVIIHSNGNLETKILGKDIANGCALQVVVPAGTWFGGRIVAGGRYVLCGCTMAPGFDFEDFELGERHELLSQYPEHREEILALTRTREN